MCTDSRKNSWEFLRFFCLRNYFKLDLTRFLTRSAGGPLRPSALDPATGKKFSDLNVYVHGPADNIDQAASATWSWDSGWSASNCTGVSAMLPYANYWESNYNNNPTQGVRYSGFGPNSNSFAGLLGKIGGFSPARPPGATGWAYWLP